MTPRPPQPDHTRRATACLRQREGFRRAFTLLELILVGVLVALMAGLTLPRLSGWSERSRLEGEARLLEAAIDSASSRALTEARTYYMVIDADAGEYAVRPAEQTSDPAIALEQETSSRRDRQAGDPESDAASRVDGPRADWAGPFRVADGVSLFAAIGGRTATEIWVDFQPNGTGAPASFVLGAGRHAVALVRPSPVDGFARYSVTEPVDE